MKITGNADESFKQSMLDFQTFIDGTGRSRFGDSIIRGLVVTHASVEKNADEPLKTEGKVICELMVTEDMLNGGKTVHGGCSAYLIDMCSTLVLMACGQHVHVSQSLNIVYHSPATLGEKLRIINTTMTIGRRTMTARTEIWNATKHRLVASGVHIKMAPSPSSKL
ncbi:HotDog domain-containing protein [Mycena leptocephala]|nr:HotDog domain-containing protein [Mycena leptocephala]